jgi:hypothetical protein
MNEKVLQIPEELLNSKEYKALEKQMGDENCRAFFQQSTEHLKERMANNQVEIKEATIEAMDNPEFKRAKQITKDLMGGLRDLCKPLVAQMKAAALIVAHRNEAKRNTSPKP